MQEAQHQKGYSVGSSCHSTCRPSRKSLGVRSILKRWKRTVVQRDVEVCHGSEALQWHRHLSNRSPLVGSTRPSWWLRLVRSCKSTTRVVCIACANHDGFKRWRHAARLARRLIFYCSKYCSVGSYHPNLVEVGTKFRKWRAWSSGQHHDRTMCKLQALCIGKHPSWSFDSAKLL